MRTLRIIGVVSASALLLSATVAFAEERSANSEQSVKAKIEVKAVSTAQKEVREAAKARMEATREEAKQRVETAREEAKMRIEAVREEAKTRVEAKREKAAQRVAEIQDKAKQKLAEKLANQFERLNKTWTDHFMNLLDRYDKIVLKMRSRASAAAGNGRDVTAADAAIQSAEVAIQTARAAVVAQVKKDYALDTSTVVASTAITTPSGQGELMKGLRTAFQDLHRSLFKDLFALRDGPMKDARTAVQNALQELGKVPKVDDDEDGTATSAAASNQ